MFPWPEKKSSPVIKSFPCFALMQLHCSSSSYRAAYRPAVVYEAVKSGSLVPRDPGILPAGWHTPQSCRHSAAKRPPTCHRFPSQGRLTLGTAAPGHLSIRLTVAAGLVLGKKGLVPMRWGQGGPGKWPVSKFWSQVCFLPTTEMKLDVFFLKMFIWVLKH